MHFQLDKNWHLQPISGDTGNTYMGVNGDEKLFIKRNSSPFLAALSKEGITPKLVWTKRTGSGDVYTAQEWLEGTLLKADEIGTRLDVLEILYRVHHSQSLKEMLKKIGGKELSAFDLLGLYAENLPQELKKNQYLARVFRYQEDHLPESNLDECVVCHGDVIRHNWIVSEESRLYLVDWDSALLADPVYDLGIILGKYVPLANWPNWLASYGKKPTPTVLKKAMWYATMAFLMRIRKDFKKNDLIQMNREIEQLKKLFNY